MSPSLALFLVVILILFIGIGALFLLDRRAQSGKRDHLLSLVLLLALTSGVSLAPTGVAEAHDSTIDIWFPVQLTVDSYTDTWGAPRSGGRGHEGTDILAPQMREVYAAQSGEIIKAEGEDCTDSARCSSYYLAVQGDDGRGYFYVHLNNDTPGRPNGCDGIGGPQNAFAPRLVDAYASKGTLRGVRVTRGEPIGFVGSSGNAACGQDQLHFEIWNDADWGRTGKTNPYPSLRDAQDDGRTWDANGPVDPTPTSRDAGTSRVTTAIELSRQAFVTAETVVLAPGDDYAEALVAAPLASALDAPLLLTWADPDDAVPAEVVAEIGRLGASRAILIGAPDRLPEGVERELVDEAGLAAENIERITAADRYGLSTGIARRLEELGSDVSRPLLALGEHDVPGRGWPDALGASAVAAAQKVPVLLTRPDSLPSAVRDWLTDSVVEEVRIVGGPAAIGEHVEEEIRSELQRDTRRIAGSNRYETSLALLGEVIEADSAIDDMVVHVATGRNFPDALAAGPSVAARNAFLLLVDGVDAEGSPSIVAWMDERRDGLAAIHAVGGPRAVADAVLDRLSGRRGQVANS